MSTKLLVGLKTKFYIPSDCMSVFVAILSLTEWGMWMDVVHPTSPNDTSVVQDPRGLACELLYGDNERWKCHYRPRFGYTGDEIKCCGGQEDK